MRREVLSDRIHLADRRAAASSARLTACLSASVMPSAGNVMQCGAAARDQGDHEIVWRQTRAPRRGSRRAAVSLIGIRHRMRRLDDLDPTRGHRMAVARDDDARDIDVRPSRIERRRHRGRGLAGPDDDAASPGLFRQVA